MDTSKQFSAEFAESIRKAISSFDSKAAEKARKEKDVNGTFDVIISTEVKDRAGETVKQDGWELDNYKNNPVVLWGHDYYSLPIGVCTELYLTQYRGVPALGARGVFLSADINPLAQQVRRMYEFGLGKGSGVGCTTSVGFIPRQRDEEDRTIITRSELLEFSFVPIPANQGVGAAGRAFTEEEAHTLGLDITGLKSKGMDFIDKKEVDVAGDDEQTQEDTGTDESAQQEGEEQAEGEKTIKDPREPQKQLVKALSDEQERHVTEIDKALEDFAGKTEGEPTESAIREAAKDLRSSISDEQTMHRANAVTLFRSFVPTSDVKTLDRAKHLKALRTEHDEQDARELKALEEFEERCIKSVGASAFTELADHVDALAEKLEAGQRTHKKSVTKLAKGLAREALAEDEIADEKTVEIVKEAITPFVDAKALGAVSIKVAAQITAERRKQLGEAHSILKTATAIVEELHGALGDVDGDESRSIGDDTRSQPGAPVSKRSRPAGSASATDSELQAHLIARETLKEIATVAGAGLEKVKNQLRDGTRKN